MASNCLLRAYCDRGNTPARCRATLASGSLLHATALPRRGVLAHLADIAARMAAAACIVLACAIFFSGRWLFHAGGGARDIIRAGGRPCSGSTGAVVAAAAFHRQVVWRRARVGGKVAWFSVLAAGGRYHSALFGEQPLAGGRKAAEEGACEDISPAQLCLTNSPAFHLHFWGHAPSGTHAASCGPAPATL